jgi:hypothetical protein
MSRDPKIHEVGDLIFCKNASLYGWAVTDKRKLLGLIVKIDNNKNCGYIVEFADTDSTTIHFASGAISNMKQDLNDEFCT